MIRLFPWYATSFESNGIGILTDVIDAVVVEEINGIYELDLSYPITGANYDKIQTNSILCCRPNPYSEPQGFRVYKITKPLDGVVDIFARHVSYDLAGVPVKVFNWGDVENALTKYTAQRALDTMVSSAHIIGDFPFTFTSHIPETQTATMQTNSPKNFRELMLSDQLEKTIVGMYGGEFEFDNFDVILHEERGLDQGYILQYGKNITSLMAEEDVAETYTHIYPYYYVEGDGLQYLNDYVIPTGLENAPTKVLMLDLTTEFTEMPTQTVLRNKAMEVLDKEGYEAPLLSLDVSFVSLEDDPEYYDLQLMLSVGLGDTISVRYKDLGVDATVRCISTQYNVVTERYDSISLGDHVGYLVDTIAQQKPEEDKKIEAPVNKGDIAEAIETDKIIVDTETGITYRWRIISTNGNPVTVLEVVT